MLIFDLGVGLAIAHLATGWFETRTLSSKIPLVVFSLIFLTHSYGWAAAFSRSNFPVDYQEWHDEGRDLRFGTLEYQAPAAVNQSKTIMIDRSRLQDFLAIPEIATLKGHIQDPMLVADTSRRFTLTGNTTQATTLVLKRFYWKYWRATDLRTNPPTNVPIQADAEYGLIRIDLSTGPQHIQFSLPTTQVEYRSRALSLASLLVVLSWCFVLIRQKKRFI
jgi:hypothetical protein